jgi:hypothetical protein
MTTPDLMTAIAELAPESEELPDEELARRLAALRQDRNSIIVTVRKKAAGAAPVKRTKKLKEASA